MQDRTPTSIHTTSMTRTGSPLLQVKSSLNPGWDTSPKSRSSFPRSKNKHVLDSVDNCYRLITHSQFKIPSLSILRSAAKPISLPQVRLLPSQCRIQVFPPQLPLQVLQVLIHYSPKLRKTHGGKDAPYPPPALNWESKQLSYIGMQIRALNFYHKRQDGPIYSHTCHSKGAEHIFTKLGSISL